MKCCLDCGNLKSKKGLYCKKCGYKHRIRPTGLQYVLHKENPTSFKKGFTPWNKGKIQEFFRGKTYDGLHDWVERNLGKPRKCDICGTTNSKVFQWSNKSGQYKMDFNDWQRLCVKCHCLYDFVNFGARKEFYL